MLHINAIIPESARSVRRLVSAKHLVISERYISFPPSLQDRDPYKPAHPTADCQFVRKLCEMVRAGPQNNFASNKNLHKLGLCVGLR